MHIQIRNQDLIQVLSRAQGVVERATRSGSDSADITQNFLLEVVEGVFHATATDLTMRAGAHVRVAHSEDGSCTANAALLYDMVRALPAGGDTSLKHENEELVLRSGASVFSLPTLPPEDYPGFSQEPGSEAVSFKLPLAVLARLFRATLPCTANNETRYYLNGVYLHVRDKKLVAVATDGLRLACIQRPAPRGSEKMKGVIVPRKAVVEILRIADDMNGGENGGNEDENADNQPSVRLEVDETLARFNLGEVSFITKLIDGAFPDYQRVIPDKNNREMVADAKTLHRALRRALVVADPDQGSAVQLVIGDGGLVLSASDPRRGRHEDKIDVQYSAEELTIGFNGRLLAELVEAASAQLGAQPRVRMDFLDPVAPFLMHAPDGEDWLYVLMPLKI